METNNVDIYPNVRPKVLISMFYLPEYTFPHAIAIRNLMLEINFHEIYLLNIVGTTFMH